MLWKYWHLDQNLFLLLKLLIYETPDEEALDDESLENITPQWQEQQPLTSAGRISSSRTSPFPSIMSFQCEDGTVLIEASTLETEVETVDSAPK